MNIISAKLNLTSMMFYDAVTDREINGICLIFTFAYRRRIEYASTASLRRSAAVIFHNEFDVVTPVGGYQAKCTLFFNSFKCPIKKV